MRLRFYQAAAETPAQEAPEREEAEDPARVDEAHAGAERLRLPVEPVEQSGERLRRVDGIEDDTLRARKAHDRVELLRAHLPAPRALVAVEQPDLRRRLDGERVAAARLADDARHVVADARGFPRDGHADDVPAQAVELRWRRALEREDRPETEARRDRGERAAAVGLERAAGDQRVGALGQRLADEELELPDLVARLEQSREIVALHPQLDAQLLGQALE